MSINNSKVLVASFLSAITLFVAYTLHRKIKIRRFNSESKTYRGSCHCKNVQFEVIAPKHLVVWDCNCSICKLKKNWHFIIPNTSFQLLSGEDNMTEYKFNSKVARHMFCNICGVQSYYFPRSNPDGVAVTFACIDENEVESYEIRKFDGQNWESFFKIADISKFSSFQSQS